MNVASINKQALAQTYYIIDSFSETNKNRIPNTLINTISENMDKQYTNTKELLQETKELLYAILNKYVLSQSQKDKLSEYYRYYDAKIEEEKSKKYKYENLFKNTNTESIKEEVALIEVKEEKWYKKIFDFLKKLLKK